MSLFPILLDGSGVRHLILASNAPVPVSPAALHPKRLELPCTAGRGAWEIVHPLSRSATTDTANQVKVLALVTVGVALVWSGTFAVDRLKTY